jgi:hypothetical protein
MTNIEAVLLSAFVNFLVLGSVAGLILSALLIFQPQWLARTNPANNRWVSTRHIDKMLESPIDIDSWFYRYRRVTGFVTLAGAIYLLYFFGVQIDKGRAISGLAQGFQMTSADIGWLFNPMELIVLLGAVFALLVSLLMLFRPGRFRLFEHGANKWVSLRRTMKPLEILHNDVDEFTFRHTPLTGVMLLVGSIYTLVMLTFWA